jgi:hypothetical protein
MTQKEYLDHLNTFRKRLAEAYDIDKKDRPKTTGKYHEWLEDQCFRQALTAEEFKKELAQAIQEIEILKGKSGKSNIIMP